MAMQKLCSNCGGLHDFNEGRCQRGRVKPKTEADTFRRTRRWSNMSKRVRERDHYLCQICIIEAYDTYMQYNSAKLEVNHILPAEQYEALRLEPTNLITLCTTHHKMADSGKIPVKLMQDLARLPRDYEKIKAGLREGRYPPTLKRESG